MLGIGIIYVGEPKESYIKDGIAEYEKRLSGFARVKSVCIKAAPLSEHPSPAEIKAALEKESSLISSALAELSGYKKVALCVEGSMLSSEELALLFDSSASSGYPGLAFVIGSSFGLSESVKSKCELRLSFSKMTFPHSLMRLILCEQIYRAFTINAGTRYHK